MGLYMSENVAALNDILVNVGQLVLNALTSSAVSPCSSTILLQNELRVRRSSAISRFASRRYSASGSICWAVTGETFSTGFESSHLALSPCQSFRNRRSKSILPYRIPLERCPNSNQVPILVVLNYAHSPKLKPRTARRKDIRDLALIVRWSYKNIDSDSPALWRRNLIPLEENVIIRNHSLPGADGSEESV